MKDPLQANVLASIGSISKVARSLLVVASVVAAAPVVGAQEGTILQEREDIIAAIPDDIGPEDVGRLYTDSFAPLIGEGNSIRRDGGVRLISRMTTERVLRVVQSEHELALNARVWQIGGGLSASDVSRHGYYRAWEARRITELDPSLTVPSVPPGAEWYISAVYEGRLYEAHFWSSDHSIEATLSMNAVAARASIRDFAAERRLQWNARTVGLEPTSDDALFATNEAEMRRLYVASDELRPILVRFSRVPRSARARVSADSPRRVKVLQVRFPPLNRAHRQWDGIDARPDMLVNVSLSGRPLQSFPGPDNTYTVQFDRVLGDSITASPQHPLVFEFFDRDVNNDDGAGQVVITTFPETSTIARYTSQAGVELTLEIAPGVGAVSERGAAPAITEAAPTAMPVGPITPVPITEPPPQPTPVFQPPAPVRAPPPPVIFVQPGRGVQRR